MSTRMHSNDILTSELAIWLSASAEELECEALPPPLNSPNLALTDVDTEVECWLALVLWYEEDISIVIGVK